MDYTPRNRQEHHLHILELVVVTPHGKYGFSPNTIIQAVYSGDLPDEVFPDLLSDISGEPALEYYSNDLRLLLTPDELARLVFLDLTKEEYTKLVEKYGLAYEWHEDFYDPETGEALQPKGSTFWD